jgi:DNA invertase Pin-like site-specific DNA recombinase
MAKVKEVPIKVREQIVSMHKQMKGYKTIAKALNIPRNTIGSVIRKFRAKGTVLTSNASTRLI